MEKEGDRLVLLSEVWRDEVVNRAPGVSLDDLQPRIEKEFKRIEGLSEDTLDISADAAALTPPEGMEDYHRTALLALRNAEVGMDKYMSVVYARAAILPSLDWAAKSATEWRYAMDNYEKVWADAESMLE